MPIYEYLCSHCGKLIEKIQRRAEPDIPCPTCGASAQRRVSVFSSAGQDTPGGCAGPPGAGFG
jgi:putative FmdB family regulatory protein